MPRLPRTPCKIALVLCHENVAVSGPVISRRFTEVMAVTILTVFMAATADMKVMAVTFIYGSYDISTLSGKM